MNKQIHQICTLVIAAGFLLGLRGGRLTLWSDNDPHPVQIYDIREDTLSPADRLSLRRGIRVENRQQLWEILENYMD